MPICASLLQSLPLGWLFLIPIFFSSGNTFIPLIVNGHAGWSRETINWHDGAHFDVICALRPGEYLPILDEQIWAVLSFMDLWSFSPWLLVFGRVFLDFAFLGFAHSGFPLFSSPFLLSVVPSVDANPFLLHFVPCWL